MRTPYQNAKRKMQKDLHADRMKCAQCGSPRNDHRALTLHCPVGEKLPIAGVIAFSVQQVFQQQEAK
jgi:hypothetical protein